MTESELVLQAVWTEAFERPALQSDAEQALWSHLQAVAATLSAKASSPEALRSIAKREIQAKLPYINDAWGYFEAANIGINHTPISLSLQNYPASTINSLGTVLDCCFSVVAKVDECIIALQEKKKKEFLDPLSWDLVPHPAIISTVEAVLLLFNISSPAAAATKDTEAVWRNVWGLWIVKNIDAHRGGWEWVATNEPTGLFTKPYYLSPDHLDRVEQLLEQTYNTPDSHHCWHRMQAYACLRNWAAACTKYVHMMHHCLPMFPAYADIQKLVTPPQRTPQANVWFRLESPEGIEYFYNRLLQSVTLVKPEDFDGANAASIPGVIEELIQEVLQFDVATRLELEKRSRQRARDKLLAEDEWIECMDVTTTKLFYYSLKHCRVMWTPPENGAFITSAESVAYAAVLRLQAAYRRRRLEHKLQVKRTKRSSLPVFSAFLKDNQSKFYS